MLFSDSRQRAAKLARDMSDASDISAARQLFAIAIKTMEEQTVEQSMNSLYDYFCLAAGQRNVQMFHAAERTKFAEDCAFALNNYNRCVKRGIDYTPRFTIANAPVQMQEYLLRLFAGGYNTLYDSATSWIEPTDQALFDAVDALDENHITVTDEDFIDFFNAWMLSIFDMSTAIGHTINDTVRLKVRPNYGGYGLDKDWGFSKVIREIMDWNDENETEIIWKRVLKEAFLDSAQPDKDKLLLPTKTAFHYSVFEDELKEAFDTLKEKCRAHPELFGVNEGAKESNAKMLLAALYEEGIIPTYSFPKNVVSTYIPDMYGNILYEVDRGLDVAIGEYAPGREIVVDK